ncbi:beta-propeller fold lactonase family protein [Tepidibacter aestuarii]|uniref:beta-propeller fold lactonase family protein n=1 Tax=Tepidibacter aestuarii TaxID=2925782 RepID=UPI0020C02882|nr:YncE family protein [Tepidibacter aestuarii]
MPTFAYVANGGNKVSVIDTNTNTVVNTIPVLSVDNFTKVIAITPDGKFAYVTNLYNVVAVIDTCTNTVVDTITVGDFPVGIEITPNGKYVYVTNSGLATSVSSTVSVIDTNTNIVVDTIPVGRDPIGIAITPNGNFAYVTNTKSDNVSVIDTNTNTVVNTITVGDFPQGIAITPNGNFAYVANQGQSAVTNTVSVINTSTNIVVDTITVGTAPSYIAITPDGNFAYVTNIFDDNVSVIDTDTNTVVQSVPVGACPLGIAITPDGNFAYVTNTCDDNVSVIDTNTNIVVDTIPVGALPLGIAIANIDFPCPTPLDRMCIETTRIFDSCMFEEELRKTFEVPNSNKTQDIQCNIIKTKCSILDITQIDQQQDLVDVKLQIKVLISFTSKCFNDNTFKRVACFDKNITLVKPEGADVYCDINNVTCSCSQSSHVGMVSCNNKLCCTVKVTAVVKSKKLVQFEVPVLKNCEPKQCCPNKGIIISPGKSYPLPNEPSEINSIMFVAKTDPGITSRVMVFLYGLPSTFATVTEELKQFKLNLPGGPYPVENVSLKNLGNSTIYIYNLTTK